MTDAEFVAAVQSNPINRRLLERLPALDLPDAWLVSGALFQTVWNRLTDRAPDHGIRDYDIFYFDPDDSWAAEDGVIGRVRNTFADVDAEIEVRNQARVHLWYSKKFDAPYSPLARATDGIDRFLMHNAQVGIRTIGGTYEIYAPRGLGDVADMIVRPNITANFRADLYYAKAERWKALWPEITILPA
jgi:uncharacterized protein